MILLSIIFTTKQIIDVIIFFSLRLRVRGGVIRLGCVNFPTEDHPTYLNLTSVAVHTYLFPDPVLDGLRRGGGILLLRGRGFHGPRGGVPRIGLPLRLSCDLSKFEIREKPGNYCIMDLTYKVIVISV